MNVKVFPLALVSLAIVSCDSRNKLADAQPAPTPLLVAPDGIFSVVEAFTLTQRNGLYSFRKGKKVTLIREEGNDFVVTDGKMQAKAPKRSFTNKITGVRLTD